MNIALIGFRGTGKSVISGMVAKSLDKKLISIDKEVTKKTMMPVSQFIKKHGMGKFREVEAEVIESISELDDCIFDTSGGMIMRNENITNLKKNALMVLLTADLKTITSRINNSKKKDAMARSDYFEEIKDVLKEREPRYRNAADYAIDTSGVSPEEVCDVILHYIKSEMR